MLLTRPEAAHRRPPGRRRRRGTWVLAVGTVAAAAALALAVLDVMVHPLRETLTWFDLRVYLAAGQAVVHSPTTLYSRQMVPGFWFTYTPFAALAFAGVEYVPGHLLPWLLTAASVIALGLALWRTLGALGWRGRHRVGATLAISAVALWTEPVMRTLRLGQVDVLLMLIVVWDLCQSDRRWLKGAGVGLAAAVKLVPLIFVAYLVLTRKFRQALVALLVFAAATGAGYDVLPRASAQWWFGFDFLDAARTGFVGFLANQSLRGLFTRAGGSVTVGFWWWLDAAAVALALGLWAAVRLHAAGRPVEGWLTCALTGLLVSPISWDHHWVWIAPALAVIADAAVRARRAARWVWWSLAALLAALFGGWPNLWTPHAPLVPWGLLWYAHGSPGSAASHPWDSEYHWHGLEWLAGNLYILVGIVCLAGLALAARLALPPGDTTPAAELPMASNPSASTRLTSSLAGHSDIHGTGIQPDDFPAGPSPRPAPEADTLPIPLGLRT